MSPVKKRALISSATVAALIASQMVAGSAAYAGEHAESDTTTTVSDSAVAPSTSTLAALEALGEEEDASSAAAHDASSITSTSSQTNEGAPESQTAPTRATTTHAGSSTETTDSADAVQPKTTTPWIDLGFANWNFKDSFRDYVGVEYEERIGVGLVGNRFSWYPKNNQKFDLNNPTQVRFGGEVSWNKYEGVLQVRLSNPTIDFQKKQLLVDAYTKGTLSGGGELTVTQEALLDLPDLTWENRNGYILVHSLKPRITELSRRILGFYEGEIGAPFVATLETRELGNNKAPQPVLSDLFPEEFPSDLKQLSDPSEPVRDLTVPDPGLRHCILWTLDLKAGTPITNKVMEQLQSFKCLNPAKPELRIESLEGLQHAKNLTSLNLNYNNITDLTPLAGLTKLQELEVASNKLHSIEPLGALTELTRLDVSQNKLSNLKGMEKMAKLERLDAQDNRISDISALPPGAEELRQLNLANNRLSDLSPLASELWLRELYLENNHITSLKGIDKLRGIEKLKIQNNYIEDPSALASWGSRDHVISMYVSKNAFTDWSVLENAKNKIRDWPAQGEEASAVNPVSLEEAKAKAAQIDAADPTPSQPNPSASTQTEPKKMLADLHWGVRDSFRRYITTVAHGEWTVSEGATWTGGDDKINGHWVFPAADGQTISRHTTNFAYKGKLRFVGHDGKLDITIANPSIEKVGQEWKLFADVHSKPLAGGMPFAGTNVNANATEPITGRIALATVGAPAPDTSVAGHAYTFTSATLTDQGSAVFGNVYDQDRRLDTPRTVLRPANTPSEGNGQGSGSQDSSNTGATEAGEKLTADLNWGIRDSFIAYINKPFVAGQIVTSEGAQAAEGGGYSFPVVKTETITREGLLKAQFAGKIHITGHGGKLDISIARPSIDKTPAGWKLSATVASKPFNTSAPAGVGFRSFRSAAETSEAATQAERVILADLSEPIVTTSEDITTYAFKNVVLTEDGARAFGGFYRAGDRVMAPLNVLIRTAPKSNAQSGDNEQSGTNATEGQKDNATTADEQKKPDTNSGIQKPAQPTKPEKKQCQVDPHKMRITSGNLSWGVRSSFTSYIRGLAKGGWDLAGVSWDGSDFNFPVAGGVYNTATRSGTIYYSGTVHFYGHKGVLDVTIANPVLEINGNSGDLYMTVNGSDTSGNKFALGRVHFASVYFNGVYASNGSLSFDGATVTLSGSGAQAFAGFYGAGEALDAMSSYTSMVPATACDPVTGDLIEYNAFGENLGVAGTGLASTGATAGSLAALSFTLLLFGAVTRRRVTR